MAVVGTRYASGFSSVQSVGTLIHAGLLAQGWDIQFANTGAVGSGNSTSPSWDSTNYANSPAGRVIYRMPAFGVLTRWFVQIEFFWRQNTVIIDYNITIGTGVTSGVLLNPGLTYGGNAVTAGMATSNGDSWLSFWEHGFLFGVCGASYTFYSGFERRRDFSGNIQDDCVMYALSAAAGLNIGGAAGNSDNLVRSFSVGERTIQPLGIMIGQRTTVGIDNGRTITTFNQPSGNIGFPMGFYTTSGGLGGMLRLAQLWWSTDSNNIASQDVYVDGVARQYFGINIALIAPNGQRILLAQN